ncbi:hypothetical protein BH18THE2_BH18THE2_14430 [soil metagenome]
MNIKGRITILLFIGVLVTSIGGTANPVQGETGKGEDIFKVILTIFGVDKSRGDVVAIVAVNNGEVSKVKFLDTDAFLAPSNITQCPSTTNPTAGSAIIEYVATFPNITVDVGEEYKACVLPVKDLEMICTTGNNSPASRPEFVDLSLNATSDIEQLSTEDSDSGDEDSGEDGDNGDLSPGIPPTG